MARPKVIIAVSNGNLNLPTPSEFGTSVILIAAPAEPVAGYGVAFEVRNKKQVSIAFAQAGNEPVVTAINEGFFAEAPEGTKVYILAMAATTTLTQLFASVNANKALNLGNGNVRLVAAVKWPDEEYEAEMLDGFDKDVHDAVTAAQTLSNAWFAAQKPFRYLLQGFGYNPEDSDAKDYAVTANRNGGIVVGSINDNSAQLVLLAMGRAAKIQPQQNIGRIKSGSLNIAESAVVKIGDVTVEDTDIADLELLYDKRYITVEKNETDSGYVFNDDNTLTAVDDDYNNLRYGRVIDNATRISFKTYYKELKDDVDVDEDGRLGAVVEKGLENAIELAINEQMGTQLSKKKDSTANVNCLVNPDPIQYAPLYAANDIQNPNFNTLTTGRVYLFLQLKPKGCLKYLNVYIGFIN